VQDRRAANHAGSVRPGHEGFDLLTEARAQLGGFFAAGKHRAVVQASLRLLRQAGIGDLPLSPPIRTSNG
jgi:hypothetical protein